MKRKNSKAEPTNSIIASTEAQNSKNTSTEPAAQAQNDKDTNAKNSKKSRFRQKSASGARTSKIKANGKLVRFLVEKFVMPQFIVWGRDGILASKLAIAYPNEVFWRDFKITRQVESMAMIYCPEGRRKIKRLHDEYTDKLKKMQNLELDKPSKTWTLGEKCGQDAVLPPKKRTLKEFLQ